MSLLKEISITELSNLRIGHTSDHDAKTGVTVLYFPNGAKAGCDISGGGPASRETPLTSPVTADNPINAIVLSGGSAYGLAAADGVMNYLESQNIGYNTGAALVPLVCQSCIYDLSYGDPKIRPTAKMGEEACRQAFAGTDTRTGNIGAGTGATVGKLYGMKQSMKSGLGIAAVSVGNFQIAAVVIEVGDFITFDFGAVYKGYHSDMTRTLVVGLANSWQQEIYTIVEEAQRKGLKAAEAGMTGRELDAIVRDSITACGYGDYYVHGTGHGVGLEIHEMPMINKRGATVLQTGMIFTIEPGIYIPGKGGVRIEDTVVLTEDGASALNGVKKQLIEIV